MPMRRLYERFAISALVFFGAASSASAAPAAWPDLNGIYWMNSYSPKIVPVGGGDPPYKPEALAEYRKNAEAVKSFALDDKARKVCTPDGVPRVLASPYPFEIVQTPNRGEIHVLYELNHVIRLVTMDKPMPPVGDYHCRVVAFGSGSGERSGLDLGYHHGSRTEIHFVPRCLGAPS